MLGRGGGPPSQRVRRRCCKAPSRQLCCRAGSVPGLPTLRRQEAPPRRMLAHRLSSRPDGQAAYAVARRLRHLGETREGLHSLIRRGVAEELPPPASPRPWPKWQAAPAAAPVRQRLDRSAAASGARRRPRPPSGGAAWAAWLRPRRCCPATAWICCSRSTGIGALALPHSTVPLAAPRQQGRRRPSGSSGLARAGGSRGRRRAYRGGGDGVQLLAAPP